jgi:hypothetical protein
VETCVRLPYHEQPGLSLLVNLTEVPVHNLTLPPVAMESTWAGDYVGEDYEAYWRDESRKPYLIHWAGCPVWQPRPIDRLFTQYLSAAELEAWNQEVATRTRREMESRSSIHRRLRGVYRGMRAFAAEVWK